MANFLQKATNWPLKFAIYSFGDKYDFFKIYTMEENKKKIIIQFKNCEGCISPLRILSSRINSINFLYLSFSSFWYFYVSESNGRKEVDMKCELEFYCMFSL